LTGEQLTDLVQEQAERTGDTISVALESQGTALESSLDKLAATTAASQTGGASILTKQFGWIIAGVLAFLAVVLIWGGKRK
jgi:uncharacterized membrane protein YdbT with pleckstrin-like domain